MGFDPAALPDDVLGFLAERHLATLTTIGPGGRPHVVAVGFTFDPGAGLVRIITGATSQKAANARRGGRAAVGQVDGARWLSLEGPVAVSDDPAGWRRPSPPTPPATALPGRTRPGCPSRSASSGCWAGS